MLPTTKHGKLKKVTITVTKVISYTTTVLMQTKETFTRCRFRKLESNLYHVEMYCSRWQSVTAENPSYIYL